MHAVSVVLARLLALVRRNATTDEIHEELRFHVDMRTDEYARDGLDRETARRAALRRFGNVAVIQDRGYDVRGGGVMETMLQDVRYTLRQLRRQPSFSILAVMTLALGIGVSTALFSVIDAALLRPLPYANPEQLVTIDVEERGEGKEPSRYSPSMADIRAWRTLTTIVAHAGMGRPQGFMQLIVDAGSPQRLIVAEASDGFLETYGVAPILGRSFQADDTRDGSPPVALLGHAFWQRELGGDTQVIGRTIRIQDKTATIVGVLPAGFYRTTAVWQARQLSAAMAERRGTGTPVIARLRPGVTLQTARAAMEAVTGPASLAGKTSVPARVAIESMYDDETSQFGATIKTLALAVGLLLLIACVNVAGLLLARGATRDVELAIRASIGAGRGRLVRQLLTESVILALAGASAGVLIAYASLDSIVALIPLSLPPNAPVAINATVLTFALALAVFTAVCFGLVPALKLSRAPTSMTSTLAVGGRSGAPLSKRGGQWLIGVEVALALVLITGAGLVVRSFARLVSVDRGFDADRVLALEAEPIAQVAQLRRDYYAALTSALGALPEIESVGAIDQLALGGGNRFAATVTEANVSFDGPRRTVMPGYFEAMRIRPIAGRLLADADRVAGTAVVVNATAAQQYFAGQAVGRTLTARGRIARQFEIVGVVPDMRLGAADRRVRPEMFVVPDPTDASDASLRLTMIVRPRDGTSLSIERLKQTADAIGPRVLLERVVPVSALFDRHVAAPRHRMLLLSMLGTFGLLLTLVGVFSMTAYAVARRTREIGVRVAFGARPGQVIGVMIRDVIWPLAFGLAAGLAGAYYATRVVASFLFQTTPHDPMTLAAAAALLAIAALAAAWWPARRAVAVDPVAALRAD